MQVLPFTVVWELVLGSGSLKDSFAMNLQEFGNTEYVTDRFVQMRRNTDFKIRLY